MARIGQHATSPQGPKTVQASRRRAKASTGTGATEHAGTNRNEFSQSLGTNRAQEKSRVSNIRA